MLALLEEKCAMDGGVREARRERKSPLMRRRCQLAADRPPG
jgi:hypothetical protein